MTERKAEEFCRIMLKSKRLQELGFDELWGYLLLMGDIEWDAIMSEILTNRTRDMNVHEFTIPKLSYKEIHIMFDLIWLNNECGLHNSYWSRIIWMAKGGKLIKAFPVNSIMEQFERGERRAPRHG